MHKNCIFKYLKSFTQTLVMSYVVSPFHLLSTFKISRKIICYLLWILFSFFFNEITTKQQEIPVIKFEVYYSLFTIVQNLIAKMRLTFFKVLTKLQITLDCDLNPLLIFINYFCVKFYLFCHLVDSFSHVFILYQMVGSNCFVFC